MKEWLKTMLGSKKFLATAASLAVIGLSKAGVVIEPDTMQWIVGSLSAYVVGQGLADVGKEARKVDLKHAAGSGPFKILPKAPK